MAESASLRNVKKFTVSVDSGLSDDLEKETSIAI